MRVIKNNADILSEAGDANKTKRRDVFLVDPRYITVDEGHNVRDFSSDRVNEHISALVENIRENGVQTPLECRRESIGKYDGETVYKYTLIDGECRFRAINILLSQGEEISRVPVLLERENSNAANRVLDMLNANESLRFAPIELAHAYRKFENYGWTIAEIAKKLGKSPHHVSECLGLLGQEEVVQQAISDRVITANNVRQVEKQLKKDGVEDDGERKAEIARRLNEAIQRSEEKGEKKVKLVEKAEKYVEVKKTAEERVKEALELVLFTIPNKNTYTRDELESLAELLEAGHNMKTAINHVFSEKVEKIGNVG